jgi:hypothetical protein
LESIPPQQWQSTAWIDDDPLPPRYGIVASNLSESANKMFEDARSGSWTYSVHSILGSMMERITKLRTSLQGKHGVLQVIRGILEQRWEGCAAFLVLEVQREGDLFTISRQTTSAMENGGRYTIDIAKKTCECGQWQEHGYPCIDSQVFLAIPIVYLPPFSMADVVWREIVNKSPSL